jgi:DASS family divalent anion:Na+ symporter
MRQILDTAPGTGSGPDPAKRKIQGADLWTAMKWAIPIAAGLVIFLLPRPEDVKPAGWAVLAIFAATVLGLILRPLPLAAVALVGLTATMITGTLEPDVALGGFSEPTIWLRLCGALGHADFNFHIQGARTGA